MVNGTLVPTFLGLAAHTFLVVHQLVRSNNVVTAALRGLTPS
jgi:hypothetical protein